MTPKIENRETTRLNFQTEVILSDKRQAHYKGKIVNLSASGALIEIEDNLPLGEKYSVTIKLKGDTSNIRIESLVASVVRHTPCCVAVQFAAPMEWLTIFYIYRQKLKGLPPKNKLAID